PFKDTSGPSMNILIKLMSIVSLVVAPTLAQIHATSSPAKNTETKIEKNIEVSVMSSDTTQASAISINPNEGLLKALKTDGHLATGSNLIEYADGILKVNGKTIDATKYQSFIQGEKMTIRIEEKNTSTK
ncbi:MAG: hypothetical protein RLZZ42_1133, partial [Bacteroidota bacterium]